MCRNPISQEDLYYFRSLIALANSGDSSTTAAKQLAAESAADLLFISSTMIEKGMAELAKQLRDASIAAKMTSGSDERANEITKALCLSKRNDQGQAPPSRDDLENAGLILDLADFLATKLDAAYRTARVPHKTTNHRARAVVHAMGLNRPQGTPPKQPSSPDTLWRYAELQAEREFKSSDTPEDRLALINKKFLKIDAELNSLDSGRFGEARQTRLDEMRRTVRQKDEITPTHALIMAQIEMFRSATTEYAEAVAFHKANNENLLFEPRRLPQLNNLEIFHVVAERLMHQGYYFTPGIEKMSGGQRQAKIKDIAYKIADVFKNNKDMHAQEITPSFRRKVGRKKRD